MKSIKLIIAAVLVMAGMSVMGQWVDNGSVISTNDYVGIGTTEPAHIFHAAINAVGPELIVQNLGGIGGAGFSMIDDLSTGYWKFKTTQTAGFKIRDHANGLDVISIEPISAANAIYIKTGGFVGIGTTTPTSALTVNGDVTADNITALSISSNGKITTKEVEVTLTGWPDYVFSEDYNLRPLKEVEDFINKNGHLPNVPNENEIIEGGLNLGEMNKILMEKVEELTLYVIELQKQVDTLKEN